MTTGSSSVIVAVIDTGVDYTHPDLAAAMWVATSATFNGSPRPSNYHGWDFADDDGDTYPVNYYHGTHVAGTIGAIGNNSIGVPGVAYGVQIMSLKVFSDKGGGASDADIISAINYAVENGAHIINMSLGGSGPEDTVLTTAVANAVSAGVLIVVAAGNGDPPNNNDVEATWPANYASHASTQSGVISVLATDQSDQKADFSNYGAANVSIGAPGVNVLSTVTGRDVRQSETLSGVAPGTWTQCSDIGQATTCMDNTIFDRGGSANDCTSGGGITACRWGVYKDATEPTFAFLYGDNDTTDFSYNNNIDGTITSQSINTSGSQRVVLRYFGAWDIECNNDYVDVQVKDSGGIWHTLTAPNLNINEARTGFCTSSHTHTGRTYSVYGGLAISHDISAYAMANTALQVRFRFVTNGSVDTSIFIGGVVMTDVFIDVQAANYSASYSILGGTSMASPMVAGIGALVKSRFSTYTAADLKQVIMNTGDVIGGLAGLVSSGRRANAYKAVAAPVIAGISPAVVGVGSGAFTLTVNGFNFENGAKVRWNGVDRTTTFETVKQLTAMIPASDVANSGTAAITVNNTVRGIASEEQAVTITAPSSGGGGGGGCFIATAAYGSYLDPHVQVLRDFRDGFLVHYAPGRMFLNTYYRYSPPIADFIREREGLKYAVCGIITPIVYAIKYPFSIGFMLIPLAFLLIRKRKKK